MQDESSRARLIHMTNRTDVHSPVNLVTEDYEFLFAFDNEEPTEGDSDHAKWCRTEARKLTAWNDRGAHQCHHCGSWLRYVAIMLHVPTGQHIAVGETCLENRFEKATAEFQKARKQAALDRKAQRIRKLVAAFVEANPDLAWMGHRQHDDRWTAMPEASQSNGFLHDLGRKLNTYGELSDKQIAAIRPSLARDVEYAKAKAAKEAAKALEPEAGPVPAGKKVDITGEVVGRKEHFNDFGSSWKITVKLDNGSRIWFTEPGKVITERGDKISCRLSSVDASDTDASFGFGKRPSRFVIEGGES